MTAQQLLWNENELTSLEEWRQPSPGAVLSPELFGAGVDAAKMPPGNILGDGGRWAAAKQDQTGRPASPGTVESTASMLRLLTFAAGRPRTAEAAGRSAQFAAAGDALKEQLRGKACERLRQASPALALRFEASLLASCGVLLGVEHPDSGFDWALWHVEQLRRLLPHQEPAFPGAYYREIFGADAAQLGTLLSEAQRAAAKRRAAMLDTLDAIVRCEGSSAARLESAANAAEGAGAQDEGRAARAVAKLATRASTLGARVDALDAEVAEVKRKNSEAAATARRVTDERRALEARASATEDERNALRLKLTVEAEARRKLEAANVKTLEQLKAQEEARWAAERLLQQEGARLAEQELLHRRDLDEARAQAEEAERRAERQTAEAEVAASRLLEAERQRVALASRVASLEGLKAQLEQQLRLEREVGAQELQLRQQAEQSLAEDGRALAAAREAQQAAEAAQRGEHEALERARAELQGTEAKLSVANEQGLQMHVETASVEEALEKLKGLRSDDQARMLQLNADKAALQQARADLETRLRAAGEAAERQTAEAEARAYELKAQLTEAHRKLESAQAEAVRSEMYLERERQSGSQATDAGSRLQAQLDEERRARQGLAQQLAAEQALRQQALTGQQALQRELASKARESDVAAQRLHQLQAELQLARTEAAETREVAELRQAVYRERERIAALPASRVPAPPPGGVHVALMPQTHATPAPPHAAPSELLPSDFDELNRSDLWNFSSGAVARQARGADPNTVLPRITSPFHTGPGH